MKTHRNAVRLRIAAAAVVAAVHVCSFFLPVFVFSDADAGMAGFHNPVWGFEVLLCGGFGIFQGAVGWYANPLFWPGVALLAFGKPRVAAVLGLVGTLLGLTSWFARKWWFNEGVPTPIAGYGVGFYVWVASFALLLAGSVGFTVAGMTGGKAGAAPEGESGEWEAR